MFVRVSLCGCLCLVACLSACVDPCLGLHVRSVSSGMKIFISPLKKRRKKKSRKSVYNIIFTYRLRPVSLGTVDSNFGKEKSWGIWSAHGILQSLLKSLNFSLLLRSVNTDTITE